MDCFDPIQGQERVVTLLRSSLSRRKVHHAYLFTGPEGVGKRMTARALAQALCCPDRGCGECRSCRRFLGGGFHPDVHVLGPPEGKRFIPVESVRDMEQTLSLTAAEGGAKILIVDPADRLTDAAANAMLKTLEEPPASTHVILITSHPWQLLSTIRSRCLRVRFSALPETLVAEILSREHDVSRETVEIAAAQSGGSVSRALFLIEHDVHALRERILSLLDRMAKGQRAAWVDLWGAQAMDRDDLCVFIEIFQGTIRDLLVARLGCGNPADAPRRAADALPAWPRVRLLDALDIARQTLAAVERNQHPSLAFESMMVGVQECLNNT